MGSEEEDALKQRRGGYKCARENMNMKTYCDPGAELFSSALMPTVTLVSLPKAAQVLLSDLVWNLAGDTRGRPLSSIVNICGGAVKI